MPAQLRPGLIRGAEPTVDGHLGQESSLPSGQHHTGLAPSAALIEILSHTQQACLPMADLAPRVVGRWREPYEPQSLWQGRSGRGCQLEH